MKSMSITKSMSIIGPVFPALSGSLEHGSNQSEVPVSRPTFTFLDAMKIYLVSEKAKQSKAKQNKTKPKTKPKPKTKKALSRLSKCSSRRGD
jgi:hypothetical protein